MKRPAIFLDRDGTLNADIGFAHRVADLRLLEGVVAGLRRLQTMGFELLITTNQSGIARGYFGESQALEFHEALVGELKAQGISIAGVYYCPFHPTAGQGRYRCDSPLRKPRPGMILAAARDHDLDLDASFAIGDKASDVAAGKAAGCRTILVTASNADAPDGSAADPAPDCVAADLRAAADYVAEVTASTSRRRPRT